MNENNTSLINKFFDNELAEEDIALFKSKYSQEPEFKREVNILSKIRISLETASKVSFDTMIKKPDLRHFLAENRKSKSNIKKKNYFIVYKVAAIFLLLISIGIGVQLMRPDLSPDSLYTRYFQVPETSDNQRFISEGASPDFHQVEMMINKAILLPINTLTDINDIYLFGVYCMENKRFNEARLTFERIVDNSDNPNREDCEWYLGLCYLKTGKIDQSRAIFATISKNKEHKHNKEARMIIKKLD
jgi:hypothetical protein